MTSTQPPPGRAARSVVFYALSVAVSRSSSKPARTIRKHRAGIDAAINRGLSNGRHEGLNTKVRSIRRAYGFHSAEAALALVMLACGPVWTRFPRPHLPSSTFMAVEPQKFAKLPGQRQKERFFEKVRPNSRPTIIRSTAPTAAGCPAMHPSIGTWPLIASRERWLRRRQHDRCRVDSSFSPAIVHGSEGNGVAKARYRVSPRQPRQIRSWAAHRTVRVWTARCSG